MKIIADACTVILLAKSSVLETAATKFDISIAESVYREILAGKEKGFADALLTERLVNDKIIKIQKLKNTKLRENIMKDFGMGIGEAETIALKIENPFDAIATDNRQGRKAAKINSMPLVGSPEIVMALIKNKRISREKANEAFKILKKEGWFNDVLLEKLMEEIENV